MKILLVDYDDIAMKLKQELSNTVHDGIYGPIWNLVWDTLRRPLSSRIYRIEALIESSLSKRWP